jgi:hypothetical protein
MSENGVLMSGTIPMMDYPLMAAPGRSGLTLISEYYVGDLGIWGQRVAVQPFAVALMPMAAFMILGFGWLVPPSNFRVLKRPNTAHN